MCVAPKHGLVIFVDEITQQLHLYSLVDWSLVRTIGRKGQFNFSWDALCVSMDGDSVLVAERWSNRVQEVRIVDGSLVRFVGKGVLKWPQFVDCNEDVIVVSESPCHRVSVLSWADGCLRAQFGSFGNDPGQLMFPRGVRLLADGSGLVVADSWNNRLCVFTLSGEFVTAVGSEEEGLCLPYDVLECASDGGFIVVANHDLVKLSRDGAGTNVYNGQLGEKTSNFNIGNALAALPGGGMVVRHPERSRVSIIRDHCHRLQWIGICTAATRVE
jgi:hypothetical protein